MKLEVGMFIRTPYGIDKIKDIILNGNLYEDSGLYLEKGIKLVCGKEEMKKLKASHNITKLLEVGDVIIDEVGNKYPINYEFETDYNNEYGSYEITIDDRVTLFFKDGLSIVTKEQFSQMEYKVGE
jgi:hypothetical protein